MAATVATLGLTLSSSGGINPIGPVSLADVLISMALVQEIEATVLPTDIADVIAIPPIGAAQALLYVQTSQPVGMKINAETVARAITPPAPGQPGVFLILGGPLTTQLTFVGNVSASGPASILIIIGGN